MAQGPKSGSHIKGSVDDILHHFYYHYGNQRTKPEGNNNRFNTDIGLAKDTMDKVNKDN